MTERQDAPRLNCKAGKVTKSFSTTVAKGNLITTTPARGSYPNGKSIALVVSAGPKKK